MHSNESIIKSILEVIFTDMKKNDHDELYESFRKAIYKNYKDEFVEKKLRSLDDLDEIDNSSSWHQDNPLFEAIKDMEVSYIDTMNHCADEDLKKFYGDCARCCRRDYNKLLAIEKNHPGQKSSKYMSEEKNKNPLKAHIKKKCSNAKTALSHTGNNLAKKARYENIISICNDDVATIEKIEKIYLV